MAAAKFPKILYVRQDEEDPTIYIAEPEITDAVVDGGTTIIGVYSLNDTHKYRKTVEEI